MRLLIIFLLILKLFSIESVDEILKNVSKTSQNYTLDLTLANKIKALKYIPPKIDVKSKNQAQYLDTLKRLIDLQKEYNNLPLKITTLQDKIAFLKDKTTSTSKLQYIYYEKLFEIANQKLDYLKNNFTKIKESVFSKLKDVDFDIAKANKDFKHLLNILLSLQKEEEKLNIELQKWQLLDNEDNIKRVKQEILVNKAQQLNIYHKLLDTRLVIWLYYLKNENPKTFDIDDSILKYAQKIDNDLYNALNQIVSDFEKYIFGSKVLVYGAKTEFELTLQKLVGFINYPLFNVGNRVITPLNFAIFILILVVGWFIGKYYKNFIYKLRHNKNISYSTATLLANMGYYTILTFSFLFALKAIGLDLSSLAIIAGALSVGIGFGLQNVVSNFVSGIIMMFEQSIKVGDYIEIDNNTRGEVIDISMRSTIIRTNDNINLIIPNQSFIQNNVINWTLGDDIVRFRVPFGVAYGSDIDKVENVVLGALSNTKIPYIRKHNYLDVTPYVVFMQMGDSSLDFELFVWVKGEYARRPRRTRSAFLKMIYKALNEANINIPFPQTDLHIVDSVPLEIKITK